MSWKKRVSKSEMLRRAGGRRRYNAARRRVQLLRRCQILRLISLRGELQRGEQRRLAETFGVTPGTISKDYKWALEACDGMVGSRIMPRITIRGSSLSQITWTWP